MLSNNLIAVLSNRKKYIDEVSEISTSSGINTSSYNKKSLQSSADFNPKSSTNFVGLTNQGATCYLNSLLQSLFMLPEFRVEVFNLSLSINFDSIDDNSIEKQLVLLFAYMQLSDKCSVSTQGLTNSFGWTSQDSFIQQDVQECMSIIFDYFNTVCFGSSLSNFLQEKWSGEIYDRLVCQSCNQSRGSYSQFKDLQLQVKNQDTLENSLQTYTSDEYIDNIECSICNIRCLHQKGIKITKLPYILSLQLKRFDLDWNTFQKIKINDKLLFPIELDMSKFSDNQDSSICVYDLVSVLVHAGSAYAGHYYCYIHDKSSGKWYLFNDSQISELSSEQLVIALGISSTDVQQNDETLIQSNKKVNVIDAYKNAYMLLYRQRSSDNMSIHETLQYLPTYLKDIVKSDNEKFQINKLEYEYQKAFVHIKVMHNNELKIIKIHKDDYVKDLIDRVYDEFFNSNNVSTVKDSIRLREFDPIRGVLLGSINSSTNHLNKINTINDQTLQRVLYVELVQSITDSSEITESLPIEIVLYLPSVWIDSNVNKTLDNFTEPTTLFIPTDTTIHQLKLISFHKFTELFCNRMNINISNFNELHDEIDSIVLCTVDIKNGVTIELPNQSNKLVIDVIKAYDRIYVDLSTYVTFRQSIDRSNREFNDIISMLEYFDRIYNMRSITFHYINIQTYDIVNKFDIIIDQRRTIYEMKVLISKQLNKNIVGGKPKKELKDLSICISTILLEEVLTIGILDIKPLTTNKFRINIYIYKQENRKDKYDFNNQLKEDFLIPGQLLLTLVISSDDIIKNIKNLNEIKSQLSLLKLENYNYYLRYCEIINKQTTITSIVSDMQVSTELPNTVMFNNSLVHLDFLNTYNNVHVLPKQVLIDNMSIHSNLSSKLVDNCNLLLDIEYDKSLHLPIYSDYTNNHIWMKLLLWNQIDNSLSELVEIPVLNTFTYKELKELILSINIFNSLKIDPIDNEINNENINNIEDIKYNHILLAKPFTWQLKDTNSLTQLKWSNQPKLTDQLCNSPWKLKDNCIILIKDQRLENLDNSVEITKSNNIISNDVPEVGFKIYSKNEQLNRSQQEIISNNIRKQLIEDNIKNLIEIKKK